MVTVGSRLLPRHLGQTDMRKTIIFAVATTILACASVVTGVARTVHMPSNPISASSVVYPLATSSLTASVVPAT